MTLDTTPETAKARRRPAAKKVQGTSTSTRRKKHTEAPAPRKTAARIRIPNEIVDLISNTPSEHPTLDLLQAHLLFGAQHATKADRIVVTYNPEVVDLMRDWCVRMIADSRQMENGKAVAAAASRVVGFIDNFEGKNN
jgi:hypothetical protein